MEGIRKGEVMEDGEKDDGHIEREAMDSGGMGKGWRTWPC